MPSSRFIEAVTAQSTSEQPIVLVTITHADFTAPQRWCTGGQDVTSNTRAFTARAMKVSLPGEGAESSARRARILVDNIEQSVVAELRSVGLGRPQVLLEVVLAAFPNDIELSWPGLRMVAARPQGDGIECDVIPRDDSEEEWPVQSYSPGRVPGLFD